MSATLTYGTCDPWIRDRFLPKIRKTETCWLWTGGLTDVGYGTLHEPRPTARTHLAHRLAYHLWVGPIPDDLQLDHLCRVRHCVNPAHLEPVTHAENMRRGMIAQKTYCKNGHPFDEANTYLRPDTGTRQCKECVRERRRRKARYVPNARKTHCKRGHPFDETNTYTASNGSRHCRTCTRNSNQHRLESANS